MFKRLVRFLPALMIAVAVGALSGGSLAFAGDRDDAGHEKSADHGQQGKDHDDDKGGHHDDDDDGRHHDDDDGRDHDDDDGDHKGRHHDDKRGHHHKGHKDHKGHHDHKGRHHHKGHHHKGHHHGHGHKGHRHHGDKGHHHGRDFKRCKGHRTSGLDRLWLSTYVQTNLFEIAGGELAREHATTDEVRALAERLIAEHTAAQQQALALAEKLGVDVPEEPSPLQQWALRAVHEFEGADFDLWFADLQVEGHRQAIMEAEREASEGCNRKVRRLAAASIPVLQAHLAEAEAVLAGLNV
jgi:predicted outer membrane protein